MFLLPVSISVKWPHSFINKQILMFFKLKKQIVHRFRNTIGLRMLLVFYVFILVINVKNHLNNYFIKEKKLNLRSKLILDLYFVLIS